MAMAEKMSVKMVKSVKAPKEPGTYYRLLCMTGKNKGFSYFLNSKRVVMGRSEKADIQVLDGKSSREHAELALVGDQYVLTDLGSQNGIVINDLKVSQHRLVNNDKIIIGQTVYRYNKLEIENKEVVAVDDDEDELEEYEEEETKKSSKKKEKPKKKNNIMVIAIVLLGVVFLLPEEEAPRNTKRKGTAIGAVQNDVLKIKASGNDGITDPEVRDKFRAFMHRGQREYRERNYFRAIEQFELALILVPGQVDAISYSEKAKEALDQYLKSLKSQAEQDRGALKYRSALNKYCTIISFLQNYPEDERYKAAEKEVEVVEEILGYQKGEYKCF
jgi:pSer/pThr/pTyr-binding forkhead associated (FHA) protein